VSDAESPRLTYVGGPTALLEWRGLRLLTDPTLDPAGTGYELPTYALRKTKGPALDADAVSGVDVVLLSHDHHFDNLDRAGRSLLATAGRVLTTVDGAERLGATAQGLSAWQQTQLPAPGGRVLEVTATPARHGPADADRGPVVGFALAFDDRPDDVLYVSGDTVWFDGLTVIREQAGRPDLLVPHMGAVGVDGPRGRLTLDATEATHLIDLFQPAIVIPVHHHTFAHYVEPIDRLKSALQATPYAGRLVVLREGESWATQ